MFDHFGFEINRNLTELSDLYFDYLRYNCCVCAVVKI